jgi:hypothetical protein
MFHGRVILLTTATSKGISSFSAISAATGTPLPGWPGPWHPFGNKIEHLGQYLTGMDPVLKDAQSFAKVAAFYDVWGYLFVHCQEMLYDNK